MAQLKNTTIDSTSDLSLPSGTTAQRPATPLQGMIRYNTTINDTEYYDGAAWRPISDTGVEATGGTIIDTEIGGVSYRIHEFRNTGNTTFTVSKGGEVEYLIVAGGGAGGANHAGGGGAGGLITGFTTVTPQSYTITVGAGGVTPVSSATATSSLNDGGNSSAFEIIATGGGGGGNRNDVAQTSPGRNGGSGGGGGGAQTSFPANWVPGQGTAGQGFAGGTAIDIYGGGGGGAGGVGRNGTGINNGSGNGGLGISSAITGTNRFYAGGGGGGWNRSLGVNNGQGGLGGGGIGGIPAGDPGSAGLPNTGGGGGGGGAGGQPGSSGGTGIVILRYRRNSSTQTTANLQTKSLLPYSSLRNIERILVSRNGLMTYVDASNTASYPLSGTVWTDLSANGFNGDFIDGPVFVPEDQGLIRFDGLNDRIHFTNPSNRWAWAPDGTIGNSTLSFEMWTRSTDTGGFYFSRPWNGSGQYNYWLTHSGWYKTAGSTANDQSFSTLATGRWEYVCAIVTTTQTAVYRNGVIDAQFTNHGVSGAVPSQGNGGESLLLMSLYPYGGGWAGNTGFSIQGDVAAFRVYNRVLSATEVADHYAAERWRFGV
jgi:hypothetical protein